MLARMRNPIILECSPLSLSVGQIVQYVKSDFVGKNGENLYRVRPENCDWDSSEYVLVAENDFIPMLDTRL